MKKLLLSLGLAMVCGASFAQNSAIYKAKEMEQKGDVAGAAALLEEALANPKTTKFAEMYNMAAEDNAKLFNVQLGKAAQGLPLDTTEFVTRLDKMINFYTESHKADVKPDEKGRVKSKFILQNHMRMTFMLDYYNYAAMFMYQNHDTANAMKYFEKYLDLPYNPIFPDNERDSILAAKHEAYSQTAFNLASLNFGKKDWNSAIKYADRALKDTLNVRDLYIIKMQSYAMQGDSATWLKILTEGVTKTEDEGFMQNLLYYYVKNNNVAGAEAMADEIVANSPDSKASWYMKGCVELNLKKNYAAAREAFAKALAIDPNHVESNINISYTYINEVVKERLEGKYKFVGTGKMISQAQMPAYKKELEHVKSFYRAAKPYMEKARQLTPDQPRNWAYTLQMIYENLEMKAEKAEIDEIIKGL